MIIRIVNLFVLVTLNTLFVNCLTIKSNPELKGLYCYYLNQPIFLHDFMSTLLFIIRSEEKYRLLRNLDPGSGRLHPVILVPGDGGSQIEARLNRSSTGHWWCSKSSDWYDLWLNINEMLTFMVDCWKENVALEYDPDTRTTSNIPGVETRIPGFGNMTSTVEWIDKSMRGFSVYFALVVSKLVAQGYERGVNIHGAPYDFRRAANEHKEYFVNLKALIEDTYEKVFKVFKDYKSHVRFPRTATRLCCW